jgi:AcrR family transcriptional regulator
MGKVRVPAGSVVDAAVELIDEQGFEALSLSAVAAVLGVRPSALYNHVESLDDLRSRVAVTATERLTDAISTAAMGVAGLAAMRAVAEAYRAFAVDHPGQYSALLRSSPSTGELDRANARLHEVFVSVYKGAGLVGADAEAAARRARQTVHGYVTLQHAGAGSADHAMFDQLVEGFGRILAPSSADD